MNDLISILWTSDQHNIHPRTPTNHILNNMSDFYYKQHDLSKIQKLQEKGKSDKIIKYLSSSDDTVMVAALEALSRIKDEDSVNSIAHMIDNPDTKIRVEAAKALGSIGTEYAKTYLLHRLNEEQDETVKTAIKEALHTLAEHH